MGQKGWSHTVRIDLIPREITEDGTYGTWRVGSVCTCATRLNVNAEPGWTETETILSPYRRANAWA